MATSPFHQRKYCIHFPIRRGTPPSQRRGSRSRIASGENGGERARLGALSTDTQLVASRCLLVGRRARPELAHVLYLSTAAGGWAAPGKPCLVALGALGAVHADQQGHPHPAWKSRILRLCHPPSIIPDTRYHYSMVQINLDKLPALFLPLLCAYFLSLIFMDQFGCGRHMVRLLKFTVCTDRGAAKIPCHRLSRWRWWSRSRCRSA